MTGAGREGAGLTLAPIPYGHQDVTDEDVAAVVEALRGDFLTQGPRVAAFERAVAEACGAAHAVAVSSGTAGLHLAALALGLGPGDLAFVPANTFLATASAVLHAGADVHLVDIEPATLGLSPAGLEQALAAAGGRGRPRAVVPVHFAGHPVDMPALAGLARRHGLAVIEDACHALGGALREGDRWWPVGCGRWSDLAVISLHPVKAITAGEGGVVLTGDAELAARLRSLRNHGIVRDPGRFERAEGRDEPWYYEMQALGLNYRLTELQAALGRSQLGRLGSNIERRRQLADRYRRALGDLPGVGLPREAPWARHAYHLFILEVDFVRLGRSRAEVMRALREDGLETAVHYIPLYRHPYYRRRYGVEPAAFPACEAYYRSALTIPLYPALDEPRVARVVAALRRVLGGRG